MNESPADPNAGSLLESYQYDDEETTDLLHAIKNWNLKHDSHVIISHDTASASRSLSSTIATNTDSTDYDTLTASSTFENYSRNSYATNNRSTPKTPLCNYSSRPSSLTARILQNHGDPVVPFPSIQTPPILNNKDMNENEVDYKPAAKKSDGVLNQKDTNSSTVPRKLSPKKSNRKKSPLPQYVNTPQKGESDNALEILKQTALELGLDENDLGSVLPTVQKLVKVVTQHVPRLEHFVDEVCTIVGEDEIMPSEQMKSKKKKKRSRNSAAARKERMDNTVQTLKLQWPNYNQRQVSSVKIDSNPSENIAQKPPPEMKVVQWQDEMEEVPIFSYEDYQSYGAFTTAVKERLTSRRQHFGFDQVRTPISSNKDDGSPRSHLLTDYEALEEINRLIEFEQRYNTKVTTNSNNGNGSDDEGDEITSDLLKANAVTLRRFVVHFAYLFTVKQDEMMDKMNDVYVFSHEATRLIDDLKNAMGMSPNCPIHTVAREVVTLIEKQPRKGDK